MKPFLKKPARELFGGIYEEVEQQVTGRARALSYRKDYQKSTNENARKLKALLSINTQSIKLVPQS
jgi:hypothetical protein